MTVTTRRAMLGATAALAVVPTAAFVATSSVAPAAAPIASPVAAGEIRQLWDKVIDLSIAKVFREGLETTMGRAGLGTPAYSAPEQLEGAVIPDVRFDVYGLGITLYEMITGKNPWADVLNNTQELIRRQMEVMPPLLSDKMRLPRRVDEALWRAIAKDPAQRYGSMMEMGRALFELRAFLMEEARAGRMILRRRMGEPPMPGDSDSERAYRPAEPTPAHPVPIAEPVSRVIVSDLPPESSDLATTLPLRAPAPARQPPTPVMPAPRAPAPRLVTPRPAAPRWQLPWAALAFAVLITSAVSGAVVWWIMRADAGGGERAAPATSVPAPGASPKSTARQRPSQPERTR